MGGIFSCIDSKPDVVPGDPDGASSGNRKRLLCIEWSQAAPEEPVAKPEPPAEEEQVAESTTENIFSTDSSSEDDVLRGVSNVVYRKE